MALLRLHNHIFSIDSSFVSSIHPIPSHSIHVALTKIPKLGRRKVLIGKKSCGKIFSVSPSLPLSLPTFARAHSCISSSQICCIMYLIIISHIDINFLFLLCSPQVETNWSAFTSQSWPTRNGQENKFRHISRCSSKLNKIIMNVST